MANLPPLVAELIAKTDGFQAGLTRAAEAARKSSGDITGAFEKIQGALGAIGVGLSAAAISSAVKHTTELGDELFKMSQRVGASVEELSTLTVLEAAQLSKLLEEKWGVSAAAPVAAAAAPGAAAAPVEAPAEEAAAEAPVAEVEAADEGIADAQTAEAEAEATEDEAKS